jgi:hypothetical protein
MIFSERHKLKKSIDMDELRSYMSGANLRGWVISPQGNTYVAFHEGQACLEEISSKDVEEQKKKAGAVFIFHGERLFLVSISVSKNIKKFLSELTRVAVGTKGGPVERAAKDPDIKGHYGRLLDQVRLAHLKSNNSRRDVKEEAVRREMRKLLNKCRNKYGLDRRRLVDIFEDEVKLMFVEDVMES